MPNENSIESSSKGYNFKKDEDIFVTFSRPQKTNLSISN
jgi:hypothetical protein